MTVLPTTAIVVGLGNPGPEHEWTPHNLGFQVLDALARALGLIFEPASILDGYAGPRGFLVARLGSPPAAGGTAGGAAGGALLVKPTTFVNRSGIAVASLARWCAADPSQVMVVYDDIDLEATSLRIRPHGGTGGHRGVESIVLELGTDRFPRLRVGAGRPRTDAARHVLERIRERDRPEYEIAVAEAAEALAFWLATRDLERCMSRFHSRWKEGPPEGPR